MEAANGLEQAGGLAQSEVGDRVVAEVVRELGVAPNGLLLHAVELDAAEVEPGLEAVPAGLPRDLPGTPERVQRPVHRD